MSLQSVNRVQPGLEEKCPFIPVQEGGGRMSGRDAGEYEMDPNAQPGQLQQQQPGVVHMSGPSGPVNCPPGLEYLTLLDQLIVKQKVERLEAFLGWETNNKYYILNARGEQIYQAKEDTDCMTRQCCGNLRPFEMDIIDNYQRPILHLSRPFACTGCCFPCCLQNMTVFAAGNVIGFVEEEWAFCMPKLTILSADRQPILKITGDCCTVSCCGSAEFQVMSVDGVTQVGKIAKHWTGLIKEMFTDADNFGIQFPMDLSVEAKATMLAATFLIDFMFYETSNNN